MKKKTLFNLLFWLNSLSGLALAVMCWSHTLERWVFPLWVFLNTTLMAAISGYIIGQIPDKE